jgi:hypothetical protein
MRSLAEAFQYLAFSDQYDRVSRVSRQNERPRLGTHRRQHAWLYFPVNRRIGTATRAILSLVAVVGVTAFGTQTALADELRPASSSSTHPSPTVPPYQGASKLNPDAIPPIEPGPIPMPSPPHLGPCGRGLIWPMLAALTVLMASAAGPAKRRRSRPSGRESSAKGLGRLPLLLIGLVVLTAVTPASALEPPDPNRPYWDSDQRLVDPRLMFGPGGICGLGAGIAMLATLAVLAVSSFGYSSRHRFDSAADPQTRLDPTRHQRS